MHDYIPVFAAVGAGLTLLIGTCAMYRRLGRRVEPGTSLDASTSSSSYENDAERTKIAELVRSRIFFARLAFAFVVPIFVLPLVLLARKPPEVLTLSQATEIHDERHREDSRHSRGPHRRLARAFREVR